MDEELRAIFTAAIEKCRGKSAYRLAQRLGITQPSISQWKSGKSRPRWEHVRQMQQIAQGAREKGLATVALLCWLAITAAAATATAIHSYVYYVKL